MFTFSVPSREADVFLNSFGIIGNCVGHLFNITKRVLKESSIFQDISELYLCNTLDFRILG